MVVRVMHLGLYGYESRIGNAQWRSIVGFAITIAIGMALLLIGAFTHGGVRIGLWTAALAIDYAGPAWLIHVLIVAGIIVFAVGARLLVHTGDGPLPDAARLALCGGVALYLVGLGAFKLRLLGEVEALKFVAAAVLLAIGWLGGGLHGLVIAALTIAVLAVLTAIHLASG